MEYQIDFDAEGPQDALITLSGAAERARLLDLIDVLLADVRHRPGMALLFDDSALDTTRLSSEDIRVVADRIVQRRGAFGDGPLAIVAPAALTFGFARMLEAYASDAKVRIGIFWDRDAAVAWLREEQG